MDNKQLSIDIQNCGFFDLQVQLSAALANQDIRLFRIALEMGAEPTTPDDKHFSVFEKALCTYGCAPFVEECLRYGADPNNLNRHFQKAPISFAVDSRDPNIIASLLKNEKVQVDTAYERLTPLNSLAKNLSADNAADVTACIRLLLDCGASPNKADNREMTPLHYILKNKKINEQSRRELVQLFLTQGDYLDVDTHRGGELRQLLQDMYPEISLPMQINATGAPSIEALLRLLRCGEEKRFLEQYEELQNREQQFSNNNSLQRDVSAESNHTALLIEAIKRGLHGACNKLLCSDTVNVNATHERCTPVATAVNWGNWKALQLLLDHKDLKIQRQDQLLTTTIKKLDEMPLWGHVDHKQCFYTLLDSQRVDINEADPSGSTPLHFAVKYRNHEAIDALLKRGAYIGAKSVFNDLPIDGLHPDLLEKHLDRCITTNNLKAGDERFELILNFQNLIPPALLQTHGTPPRLREEMAPIAFLAKQKDYRHLLQHPLITSFLFLKWHRLSLVFYLNFLIYTFFSVSIITHTLLKFRESEHEVLTTLFGALAWTGIIYMILREALQIIMSPELYFRSPINILELVLIVLSIITCSESSYDVETKRVFAVFTILLVALELCLLVGSLPVLSISTHMLMLRAVSKSFLKSFTLYSIFVVTFSLCFYILFGKPEQQEGTTASQAASPAEEGGEFNKFANPLTAVIKTIVMLTGEFDAGDIDFDSLYSYFVFLLFVVFMSIVLFNLLNGLAVSDTQAIKAQAELNGSICRANLLVRYEEVLTGRSGRTGFIVNQEPFRTFCRRLMNLYPSYLSGRQISILPNDGNKVMVPIYLTKSHELHAALSDAEDSSKTVFVPLTNVGNEKLKPLDAPIKLLPCCCCCLAGNCSKMDSRTVKLAIAVLEKQSTAQRNKRKMQDTEMRLLGIEQKLDRLFKLLEVSK